MNEREIKKILSKGEGYTVEFNEVRDSLPENLFETVCAFLNRLGGDLLLGVNASGDVIGINPDKVEHIKNQLVSQSNNPNKLDPPFVLYPQDVEISGKKIIYIRVPQSSQVHKTANILSRREFTNAAPARFIIYRNKLVTENANNPVGAGPIDPENFSPHPKNPAIMKFFQQLGRAEELGSGIRNIKQYLPLYSKSSKFEMIEGDTFTTIVVFEESDATPQAAMEATPQATMQENMQETMQETMQVKELILNCIVEMSIKQLMRALQLKNRDYFRKAYLKPAIEKGLVEMTIPDQPKNRNQKYRLTEIGKKFKKLLEQQMDQ